MNWNNKTPKEIVNKRQLQLNKNRKGGKKMSIKKDLL